MTEPWPLPYVQRTLPADVTDQQYMDVQDEMRQELRDLGAPDELIRIGVTPQDDGTWFAQGWQAKSQWSWEWPPRTDVTASH